MKQFFLNSALIMVVLAVATTVHAKNDAKARRAFDDGKLLFEAGRFAEASDQFRKAYEMRPNWKLFYNIGQSEAAAKHFGAALDMFERYLANGGDEIDLARANDVLNEIDRLKKMVGYLDVKKAPPRSMVVINGKKRGDTPLSGPIPLSAGVEHNVKIVFDGEILFKRVIRLHSGRTTTVEISEESEAEEPTITVTTSEEPTRETKPEPEAAPMPTAIPKTSPPPKQYRGVKITGWTFVGAGVGTLVGAAVTRIVAVKKNDEIASECKNGCPLELEDENNRVKTLSTVSNVLIVAGATVAVTGALLAVVGSVKAKRARKKSLSLIPALGSDFSGLIATGEF